MADVDAFLPLAAEFPPATLDDWLTLAGDVERLRTTTYDGITIEPLYTAGDALPTPVSRSLPVRSRARARREPATAGTSASSSTSATGTALPSTELERGATSIWLRLAGDDPVDESSLDAVLAGVLFDVAPVVLDAGHRWVESARALRSLWERARRRPGIGRRFAGRRPVRPLGGRPQRRQARRRPHAP